MEPRGKEQYLRRLRQNDHETKASQKSKEHNTSEER